MKVLETRRLLGQNGGRKLSAIPMTTDDGTKKKSTNAA